MPRAAAMPPPQPLLIDAAGHTCVAWWHAPASGADASAAPALPRGWLASGALPLAAVLASSWGEEDLCGYDGLRALAIALAEAGIGTLRFEWPDTGDSSAATGSTSLADALAAFDAAATQALALSGCARLAFVGLRLGALLAAHAAVARDDVDALVALRPVASGLAFVREQPAPDVARAAAPAAPPGAVFDAAELPVPLGGFAQPVRQVEALSALRWPSQPSAALRDALLLRSSGAPGRVASDALGRLGVRVREWAHDDLSCAPAAARQPVLAPVALAEIVRWLSERAGDGAVTATTAHRVAPSPTATADAQLEAATGAVLALSAAGERRWMPLRAEGVAIRERVVRIGDPRDREPPLLAGVVSERDAPAAAAGARRGILLLSAGPGRRVGPHRLWVPWARRRAAHGDVVLRLDLPGVGDSARHARPDPGRPDAFDDRGVEAVARAVAWLRLEHGVGDCTVMGVGSGAWQAWHAALAGADVQQVVAINPPILPGVPGMSMAPAEDAPGRTDDVPGLASPPSAFGAVARALAARARHALRLCARGIARGLRRPPVDDLAAELARVSARGVALDFVFSAGDSGLARLRQEAGRRARRLASDGRLTVGVVAHADPTFAATAGRDALYAGLDALLLPAQAAAPSPAAPGAPTAGRPVASTEIA